MLFPIENNHREIKNLDGYWHFSADTENNGQENGWQNKLGGKIYEIGVPASWNEQINELYNFHGKGWYEKHVFVSTAWQNKAVYLRFGSVAGVATVFVNGTKAFSHVGTALPFEADISSLLNFGKENRITVIADSTLDPWSLPPAALELNEGRVGFANSYPGVTYDFFPYGGIQRSVWLYATNKNRIEDIIIKTEVENNIAKVQFKVSFTNEFSGKLLAKTENKVCELNVSNNNTAMGVIEIENPRLWDVGKPELYELEVQTEFDSYTQTYGIRTIEIEGDKFLLNGKPVFFKGFGKHEDFHILGKGFNHALWTKDFYLLNWIGANSFRTSHYPYDENILDYADRHGVLVIDETPFVGFNPRCYTEEMFNKALPVIEELYYRDKNHPCVVMWSLANEPYKTGDEHEWFFEGMADKMRSLDDTRPLTYVAHHGAELNGGFKHYDVLCMTRYCGWYDFVGMADQCDDIFSEYIDSFYRTYKKPVILAEFGADAIPGMHSDPALMFTEEYQNNMVKRQYNILKEKPFVVGAHVWAFADFRTAQTISRVFNNHKGVFTRDRQPKMVAHTLKELWKNDK